MYALTSILQLQPFNNYAALCPRKYSKITEIAAHNSPCARPNNAASNQQYSVTQQLNDGIRVLQSQAHLLNGTLHYRHTSCALLDVGPVEDYLRAVVAWLDSHPFEVLALIFGNYGWREQDADGNPRVTATDFCGPCRGLGAPAVRVPAAEDGDGARGLADAGGDDPRGEAGGCVYRL